MTERASTYLRWMNAEEAAEFLGVAQSTLYGYVREHRIPHLRLSPRVLRFDRDELTAWLEARHVLPV
jgi:excisionase family DNA binding protein